MSQGKPLPSARCFELSLADWYVLPEETPGELVDGWLDGRRDRVEKVADYAAFGIRYYWIVDPGLRSLEILELERDGRYRHALGATGGILEQVPGCPELVLDLDSLWQEIDRLEGRQATTDDREESP